MPRRVRLCLCLCLMLLGTLAVRSSPAGPQQAQGTAWRLATDRGPLRLFRPARYDAATAGTVIYLHGHGHDADGAWTEHQLARQFADSGRNALFIVAEAPRHLGDRIWWPSLRQLVAVLERRIGTPLPDGPLVVVAHSGAYQVVARWLGDPAIDEIVLLDALFGRADEYASWVREPERRLILVAGPRTRGLSATMVLQHPRQVTLIPAAVDHMEIVSGGTVIPAVLRRTSLVSL